MPASTIHNDPSPTGRWTVRRGDEREARSDMGMSPRLSAPLESWPIWMVSRWFSMTATRASTAYGQRGRTDPYPERPPDVSFS